jgi:hypothetical protein
MTAGYAGKNAYCFAISTIIIQDNKLAFLENISPPASQLLNNAAYVTDTFFYIVTMCIYIVYKKNLRCQGDKADFFEKFCYFVDIQATQRLFELNISVIRAQVVINSRQHRIE